MLLNGQKYTGSHEIVVPIIRDKTLYFILRPATNMDQFEKICPSPKAPTVFNIKTKENEEDKSSKKYKEAVLEHSSIFVDWLAVQSITSVVIGADGDRAALTWESVDSADPTTFGNWAKELKDDGFSQAEINRIYDGVMQINSLSDELVEAARKDFLLGQARREESQYSQTTEPDSTPSGEAVNA